MYDPPIAAVVRNVSSVMHYRSSETILRTCGNIAREKCRILAESERDKRDLEKQERNVARASLALSTRAP